MKNKLFAYAMIPALGLGFLGAHVASAHWMGGNVTPQETATRQGAMFQETAALLGISVDAVKEGWALGKSISELAKENGITDEALKEKMQAAQKSKMIAQLSALVDQGIITQAQADKRLVTMENIKGRGRGGHAHGNFGGFHHGKF
jgi:hypothetical protein